MAILYKISHNHSRDCTSGAKAALYAPMNAPWRYTHFFLISFLVAVAEPGPITTSDPVPTDVLAAPSELTLSARMIPGVSYTLESQTALEPDGWSAIETIRPTRELYERTLIAGTSPSAATVYVPVRLQPIEPPSGGNAGTWATWTSVDEGGPRRVALEGITIDELVEDGYRRSSGTFQFDISLGPTIAGAPTSDTLSTVDGAVRTALSNMLTDIAVDALDDQLAPSEPTLALDNANSPKRFWRLRQQLDSDLDWDSDGLSNVRELTISFTDPLNGDTDFDGYDDNAEVRLGGRNARVNELFTNVSTRPPGFPTGLIFSYEFEQRQTAGAILPYFPSQQSVSYRAFSEGNAAAVDDGSLHKSVSIPTIADKLIVTSFADFIQNEPSFTFSMWFQLDPGALNNQGSRGFFGFTTNNGTLLFGIDVSKNFFANPIQALRFQAFGQQVQVVNVPPADAVLDDGEWHHFLISRANGDKFLLYLDGEFLAQIPSTTGSYPATRLLLGAIDGSSFNSALQGRLDRFHVFNRALTFNEIQQLWRWRKDDADRDGVLDEDEIANGTNPRIAD